MSSLRNFLCLCKHKFLIKLTLETKNDPSISPTEINTKCYIIMFQFNTKCFEWLIHVGLRHQCQNIFPIEWHRFTMLSDSSVPAIRPSLLPSLVLLYFCAGAFYLFSIFILNNYYYRYNFFYPFENLLV